MTTSKRLLIRRMLSKTINLYPSAVYTSYSNDIVCERFPDVKHINVTDKEKELIDLGLKEIFKNEWFDYSFKVMNEDVYDQHLVVYRKGEL